MSMRVRMKPSAPHVYAELQPEADMDEQEMDVIDHGEAVDLESAAVALRHRREEMRRRTQERMDAMRHQIVHTPERVLSGMIGRLPVQTREHLRRSAREGLLAVQSLFEAIGSSGIQLVDRLFTETQTPPVPPPVDPKDAPDATSTSPSPTTSTSRASRSGT
jgi:hypothetical protein